jgi:hypothetical protein
MMSDYLSIPVSQKNRKYAPESPPPRSPASFEYSLTNRRPYQGRQAPSNSPGYNSTHELTRLICEHAAGNCAGICDFSGLFSDDSSTEEVDSLIGVDIVFPSLQLPVQSLIGVDIVFLSLQLPVQRTRRSNYPLRKAAKAMQTERAYSDNGHYVFGDNYDGDPTLELFMTLKDENKKDMDYVEE